MLWLMKTTALPCTLSRLTKDSTISVCRARSVAVGPSSIAMWLPHSTARAITTAWRWPPDSAPTLVCSGGRVRPRRAKLSATSRRMRAVSIHLRLKPASRRTRPHQLGAEMDVLGDVERRRQRQGLEHRLDAGFSRRDRRLECMLEAVDHPEPHDVLRAALEKIAGLLELRMVGATGIEPVTPPV